MKIISFRKQLEGIKIILQHLGLWVRSERALPKTNTRGYKCTPLPDEALPAYDRADLDYPFETYIKNHQGCTAEVYTKTAHSRPVSVPQFF